MLRVRFNTKYTIIILINIAIIIFSIRYSARMDSNVVITPVPAIRGNAIGIMDAVSGAASLYNRIPSIISRARKKITIEPAIAKEDRSTPSNDNNCSPMNKNRTIIIKEVIVAFSDSICPTFILKSMIIGIEPRMSITENKIKVALRISMIFSCMFIN